jgi:hypothetical protein
MEKLYMQAGNEYIEKVMYSPSIQPLAFSWTFEFI